MQKFDLWNPTKLIFGENRISEVKQFVPAGSKVLLTFGGGSIKKNGVYDSVMNSMKDFEIIEFGGIEANPQFTTLMKAVEIARSEKIDFILAVGGGSVIDGTKFISGAVNWDGDPWEILSKGLGKKVSNAIPFGSVLTLPATGSEMNSGSVVSRRETKEKLAFGGPAFFPVFSILDPVVVKSLPERQIANGVVDSFTHVLEQYITYPADAPLQDRLAESILQTLREEGPKVLEDPADAVAAGNFMWCCTMALNGTLRLGVPTDWATHMIGHELTALYGIDHARTLAIIGPNLYKVMFESKKEKLAQYGARVWNIEGSIDEQAKGAIEKTVAFFHSLGVETKISDYTSDFESTKEIIVERFESRGWKKLGEKGEVTPERVAEIVEMSY